MEVYTTEGKPIFCWATDLEDGALYQADNCAVHPFTFHHVALMADAHQGYGMPVGGVLATQDVIIPNAVGVDIGCGMVAVKTDIMGFELDEITLKEIIGLIRDKIPTGFNHHKTEQVWEGFGYAPDLEIIQQELDSAKKQLGTLGGGNHFIEIQADEEDMVCVMVHSGSRNFGLKTAKHYHAQAVDLCKKWKSDIPDKDLAFLPLADRVGQDYLQAMTFCQEFALANREHMVDQIMNIMDVVIDAGEVGRINKHHNFAQMENHYNTNVMVHRKGATSARLGEKGIIPGSMGTKSYIVSGRGNNKSFQSCSHGAGRVMGRKQAKRTLDLATEQAKMEGIVHGLRTENDLDEAPGSYKDIDVVMANQADLVNIEVVLRPLGSVKA